MHSRDHCMQYVQPFSRIKEIHQPHAGFIPHSTGVFALVFKYFGICIGIHCMTSSGLRLLVFFKNLIKTRYIFSNTITGRFCIRISCVLFYLLSTESFAKLCCCCCCISKLSVQEYRIFSARY